jgi:hypothetical protein
MSPALSAASASTADAGGSGGSGSGASSGAPSPFASPSLDPASAVRRAISPAGAAARTIQTLTGPRDEELGLLSLAPPQRRAALALDQELGVGAALCAAALRRCNGSIATARMWLEAGTGENEGSRFGNAADRAASSTGPFNMRSQHAGAPFSMMAASMRAGVGAPAYDENLRKFASPATARRKMRRRRTSGLISGGNARSVLPEDVEDGGVSATRGASGSGSNDGDGGGWLSVLMGCKPSA